MPRTGAVASSAADAQSQAKSIGATIGPDGWWYKDGKKLSHDEADALVRQAGTAKEGLAEWGKNRDLFGRASDLISKPYNATLGKIHIGGDLGRIFERNKSDIWASAATLAAGGNPMAGAAVKAALEGAKRGATGLDALKGGITGYGMGTTTMGLKGAAQGALGASGGLGGMLKGGYSGFQSGVAGANAVAKNTLPRVTGTLTANNNLGGKMGEWSGRDWLTLGANVLGGLNTWNQNKTNADADRDRLAQQRIEQERRYNLDAELRRAEEARQARIQQLSEEDRKRLHMILQNRDAELSPIRAQLMQAIMGKDHNLFGGSVMQGITGEGR